VLHGAAILAAVCLLACHPGGQVRPAATTVAAIERAEGFERERRHDEARAAYEAAVRDAPDRTSEIYARLELADALEFWGEIPDAVTQLEAVGALDPRSARAWHDLGILRHQLGDDSGARTALERAVDLAPDDARPRLALAALLWQTGDTDGALVQYRALLQLELPDAVHEKVKWAVKQLGG
jgi:Flp pilus assembly protein TadD